MSHRNHTRQRQQKNPAELPNMQAATCNYNRTVFAHLLAVTKKKIISAKLHCVPSS